MKVLMCTAVATVALLVNAPAATADDDLYLQVLEGSYIYNTLGPQTLLKEGYKVCSAVSQGYEFSDVLSMIQSDLSVSSSGAGSIYGAATAGLGC